MTKVIFENLYKSYEKTEVIHGVDLEVKSGEFIVFVGPSGCGKSTLLRMVAGLEDITSGNMYIGENLVNDVAPARREVAMVFQSYALYPHMTVYKNMAFGLQLAKKPKNEIEEKVIKAAKILQIEDYLDRLPKHLSGGQRQRVAIGRAIVRDPKVFLFDEPLSNLDAALRVQTRIEIARLHESLDATMIYVTHDQVEAMTLADRIVVINEGIIEQVGTPIELYNKPNNIFVAGFIGSPKMNFLNVKVKKEKSKNLIELQNGNIFSLNKKHIDNLNTLGVRPEHFLIVKEKKSKISGKLDFIEQLGEYCLFYIKLFENNVITVKSESNHSLSKNDKVFLDFDEENTHFFDNSGRNLIE